MVAVGEVFINGTVSGTSQYKGDEDLDGAQSASSYRILKWNGPGTVLYKLKTDALAPEHYQDAQDQGTVIVRYVVQSLEPKLTRLRIDSIFEPNSRHRTFPSDGWVETSEFIAIDTKFKEMDQVVQKAREQQQHKRQEERLKQVQAEIAGQRGALAAAQAKEQELQKQLAAFRQDRTARVRAMSADLKSSPYVQAKTLEPLNQGQTVTVLQRTASWYRVQTTGGEMGWVYRPMLEEIR
jgi:hypothetical protein